MKRESRSAESRKVGLLTLVLLLYSQSSARKRPLGSACMQRASTVCMTGGREGVGGPVFD